MDSYLVCYDVSNPKRLRRVAKVCEGSGYRRQLSVFLGKKLSDTARGLVGGGAESR